MVFSRYPNLLTERLRKVVTRDTIIIINIVAPLVALADIIFDPTIIRTERIISYIAIFVFIVTGLVRLKKGSVLDRRPIIAIVIYQIILAIAIAYLSEVRSPYAYIWLIPLFLSAFYYNKKVLGFSIAALAGTEFVKGIYYGFAGYITKTEDYFYLAAEFLLVVALSFLIIDALIVTEEDRKILVESLEKAEVEEKRLNTLINSITDSVIAVDSNQMVIEHNPATLELVDSHESVVGKSITEILKLINRKGESIDASQWILDSRANHEAAIVYPDGEKLLLDVSVMPIVGSEGKRSGAVYVIRDVTKKRSLDDERNSFISLISHELRTPLTTVEGELSNVEYALDKGKPTQTIAQSIGSMHRQVIELTKMLNDFSLVLDLSARSESLVLEDIRLLNLVSDIVGKHIQSAASKDLSLLSTVEESAPASIKTSREYLTHILDNLIINAIKFTDRGSVELIVKSVDGYTNFSVRDTGRGIAKADQADVFKPFKQAEDFETRTIGGLGIGLYISKRLADVLNGKLIFDSDLGKGTVFTLSLPNKSIY